MTKNISKQKNSDLLNKIKILRKFLSEKEEESRFERILDEIEKEIQNKKYGLVFEKHLEEVEEKYSKNQYKLTPINGLSISGAGLQHMLIEGDNFIGLKLLEKTYQNQVNIICIDPPYNTGNMKLNYNDSDYEDAEDVFVHSKWLSFMEKRIKIAKNLLVPNGVMFINIDETQIGGLILLCEQIFEKKNVDVLIWPKMDPKYDENRVEKPIHNVKIAHEYVVLCYMDKESTHFNKMIRRPNHSEFSEKEQPFFMETIINEVGTTSSAKDELKEIFGRRDIFSTPKPVKMLKEFVRVASSKDAIILDFFAGSGTTGHAVLELNKEDGGNRKFILMNNNENEICRKITYQRIKHVFSIYRPKQNNANKINTNKINSNDDKFNDGLKYYRIQGI